MRTKKKQGALRAATFRAFANCVLTVICPACDERSDVTGLDEDLCLWPHRDGQGKPCPDGERKAPILPLLAARQRPQTLPQKPSEKKP